jgi:hypothetical protein
MSVVPAIFNGMQGKRAVDTIGNMPIFGYTNNGINKPNMNLNYKRTSYLENGTPMRQSVLLSNQGGARGVQPCKGATSMGLVGGGASRVLRRPNIPYQGGMYPHTGIARHQKKGLAYSPEKPIDLPLMPLADSFNAGLNSSIPQPK